MWLLTPSRAAAAAPEHDAELDQQFAALGVRQQQIEDAKAGRQALGEDGDTTEHLQLWDWHMDALRLFEALRTQWRKTVLGPVGVIYEGLHYECIPAVCTALGLRADDSQLFNQLRTMERAGARCLNAGEGVL